MTKYRVGDVVYSNNKGLPWTLTAYFDQADLVVLRRKRKKFGLIVHKKYLSHQRVDAGPRTL